MSMSRHDHARRAIAALQAVIIAEGRLHRMQLVAFRDAFDSGDVGSHPAWPASVVQDFTALPSICTMQAPHC
jgi:hypothetical protein